MANNWTQITFFVFNSSSYAIVFFNSSKDVKEIFFVQKMLPFIFILLTFLIIGEIIMARNMGD
ncbi:hypothetical protein CRG86_002695 [Photobacterium leiognathi]|nr:hypothetical protein CRG86_002695 [Photobacterium leiognathi]